MILENVMWATFSLDGRARAIECLWVCLSCDLIKQLNNDETFTYKLKYMQSSNSEKDRQRETLNRQHEKPSYSSIYQWRKQAQRIPKNSCITSEYHFFMAIQFPVRSPMPFLITVAEEGYCWCCWIYLFAIRSMIYHIMCCIFGLVWGVGVR